MLFAKAFAYLHLCVYLCISAHSVLYIFRYLLCFANGPQDPLHVSLWSFSWTTVAERVWLRGLLVRAPL